MAVGGLALFSTLDVHSAYVSVVLPAEVIVSLGMGLSFVAMSSTALIGVSEQDAGVASALVNATQQTGGTMGAALINTIATSADGVLHRRPRHVARRADRRRHPRLHDGVHLQRHRAWPWRPRRPSPSSGDGPGRPRRWPRADGESLALAAASDEASTAPAASGCRRLAAATR